ncbi:MAG: DUF2064 domain-containing protein [Betaproteobacteria bacterium HGW-Betaproteobacteria-22]|nr:MAG: DUF2064 domain-containing protein [Betaproteobacteria bacterium HGW-Betaproteobacteria-22]
MTHPTLILLCKRPAPGYGKQRLAKAIGQDLACQVAEALLSSALEDVLSWPGVVVIAPADVKDREWVKQLVQQQNVNHDRIKVLPQITGSLGLRINALDRTLRHSGFDELIFIGSDAPDITQVNLNEIKELFKNVNVVLKPTIDGGVSIMANNQPWPDLSQLAWSTAQFKTDLTALCQHYGLSIAHLETGFDVDECEDLKRIVHQLAQDQRPARRTLVELAKKIIQIKTSKQKIISHSENNYA